MRQIALYTVSMLILLSGCSRADQKEISENKAVRVRTQTVEYREYKVAVRATGLLSTATEMKLSFKTGGIIGQLNVREGTSVRKGEVLVELDLSEVKAQVNQAHIGLEKARRDLSRAENLYQDSVVTLEVYQNAESAWEVARSQVQIADFNLEHSRIKAPHCQTFHGRFGQSLYGCFSRNIIHGRNHRAWHSGRSCDRYLRD
jgi:multidrug efflux pump subunit AcrA (membrane-fusion protein)